MSHNHGVQLQPNSVITFDSSTATPPWNDVVASKWFSNATDAIIVLDLGSTPKEFGQCGIGHDGHIDCRGIGFSASGRSFLHPNSSIHYEDSVFEVVWDGTSSSLDVSALLPSGFNADGDWFCINQHNTLAQFITYDTVGVDNLTLYVWDTSTSAPDQSTSAIPPNGAKTWVHVWKVS